MRPTLAPLIVALFAFGAAPSASAHDEDTHASAQFGPWDAGTTRKVRRGGKKGLDRVKHPSVGDVSKVPGDGPPPPPLRPDPDVPETALSTANTVGSGMSANPMYLAALVYSRLLTRVDGPRCQHYPTCSRFANQAVARHGVVGIFIALDRLIQPPQSSALRALPQVEGFGGVRHLDPLENYEFWKPSQFTGFPPPEDEEPLDLDADGGAETAAAEDEAAAPSSDG